MDDDGFYLGKGGYVHVPTYVHDHGCTSMSHNIPRLNGTWAHSYVDSQRSIELDCL
jgi:hypothetical protein